MSFHFCFVPSCRCYNMPSTRNSAQDVGINEQRKGLEEVPGGNLEGAEDTWAPSQPVQLLQVSKEGNVWNMVSVSAPLPPHWLFFNWRIKKEVTVLYSKPSKSSTGCLSIRILNALTEEMSESSHNPPVSFKTSTWDPSWSERKKSL